VVIVQHRIGIVWVTSLPTTRQEAATDAVVARQLKGADAVRLMPAGAARMAPDAPRLDLKA
jgi:hypothetical protein